MKKVLLFFLILLLGRGTATAQDLFTLDQCRTLALRQNKQMAILRTEAEKAHYAHKAAETNFLPKMALAGGYIYTSQEISLLSDDQKQKLSNLGTNLVTPITNAMGQIVQQHPELAPLISQAGNLLPSVGSSLNGMGQGVVDAFHTDTRNMMAGAVLLTQPLYMGGKIRAYNRITQYAEEIAREKLRGGEQEVILEVDQAYWQVVSLANKQRLAISYRDMLKHLDGDVQKMMREGLATKANALHISVKLNEAEMTLLKVEDGLTLSRMWLCQLCGLPLETAPQLADEQVDHIPDSLLSECRNLQHETIDRPELQQLTSAVGIYKEKVNIERSAFLPQVALMGGYLTTYPALVNGFERKFRGLWNVGVTLKMPLWNWGESKYKIRAAKADALIARYNLEEAEEKIQLQVSQSRFRLNEAQRKLSLSEQNLEKAEENLRTARIGFMEGVVTTSDLLGAQTAWLQAHSEQIDAQIDLMITRSTLAKDMGRLH